MTVSVRYAKDASTPMVIKSVKAWQVESKRPYQVSNRPTYSCYRR